jgi:hypothetical protein
MQVRSNSALMCSLSCTLSFPLPSRKVVVLFLLYPFFVVGTML